MSAHTSESSGTQGLSLASHSHVNRRSKVWQYFEPNLVAVDDNLKVVCKYCGLHLSTKSGTSSLRTHISEYCPAIDDASRKEFISTMKKQPSENFVFDPQLSRERMIEYVVHAEIPFNKFEDPYFERWIKTVNPNYDCVKRQTIRNDSFKKYEKMKMDLLIELGSLNSRVCLTSDLWTSVQNLGYMVVTAHYINVDFKLKKKIISFKEVKDPHTGIAIEEALVSCLTEWGIREKVFTLTVDNASNNNRACEVFVEYQKRELMLEGAHFHVRCCAHILNADSLGPFLLFGSMSTISDQKKRTLEALQQQYTAAKAKKLQDEQVKSQKKSNFNTPKPKFDAPRKGKGPEITPRQTYAQPSPHKGVAFSSSNRQQKPSASSGEEINPVYGELSCAFHDNLSKDGVSDLDGTEVVHSVIYDIIQKGGDAGKITKGAKKLKLEKGILLDNYVQRSPRLVDAQARSLLIHSKRSKRHMSLKQHKKCGSFDLDGTFHKYDFYKPMHEMWKDYIRELMKVTPKKKLSENLLSADLHGALLIVAECKAASYQGVNGIMIRDTAETFGIISKDNRFRVVPKAGSLFILQAECWKVTLIGDKISPREKLKEDQRQHAQSQIR